MSGAELTSHAPLDVPGVGSHKFVKGNPIHVVFWQKDSETVFSGMVAWAKNGESKCGFQYVELDLQVREALRRLFGPLHRGAVAKAQEERY